MEHLTIAANGVSFHVGALVDATRDRCRTFIAHVLCLWSHRNEAFDDVVEATDNFLKPGNRAVIAGRIGPRPSSC
jgi:hypothetical protein